MIRKYEIVCVLNTKSDIAGLKEQIKNIVINNGGAIVEENDWGVLDFAYSIQKEKQGHYFIMIANTNAENIEELRRVAGIKKEILRLMIINTEKEKNYVQSTKLSATEIPNDKIEHKTIGKKYKKRTFDIKIDEKNDQRRFDNRNSSRPVQNEETKPQVNEENKQPENDNKQNTENKE